MMGIRTQESEKFNRFFQLVQDEANMNGSVFFLDCGEGNDFEDDDIEGEELSGWLIPKEKAEDFNQVFIKQGSNLDDWNDFVAFVEWSRSDDGIHIKISLAE